MLRDSRFHIAGCASALPRTAVPNAVLARELETDEDWIESRCGIRNRYRTSPEETTLSLAVSAGRALLDEQPDFWPDLLLCSTFTPEHLLCPTAPAIAEQLRLGPIGAFDLNAACTGAAFGFLTAFGFLASGLASKVLLVASDTPTKYLAQDDRSTRILMGDGAAAVALEQGGAAGSRVLSWLTGSDGSGAQNFFVPHGGSRYPQSIQHGATRSLAVQMDGRAIFRFAVSAGAAMLKRLCELAGVTPAEVTWVIPHQANLRILDALQQQSGIPPDRWVINIGAVGNTASASIPIALAECMASGQFRKGDLVLIAGFGAGLTWAGFLLEW
ncbi:3-oxoacyl-ACP synthase III family protein [Paludibaculum fermentans]|uniref:Ketoacyl-ACP synthase III n=1 Tax=Paludibaculum fermentans TaxID=1473598 RepID=A0A7S7NLZ2_PALFE|nr:ketoacyl-ACP synthase III [Paludibaculum fermentans]QOY86056.1 ketoacyl-ACP synthase III [Paludibaculum fermentans]